MMVDAGRFARKDLFRTGQVQSNPQSRSELDKSIAFAIDEHVTGALHVGLLVTDKRICFQDLCHPGAPEPALCGVLSEGTVEARRLHVRQIHLRRFPLIRVRNHAQAC